MKYFSDIYFVSFGDAFVLRCTTQILFDYFEIIQLIVYCINSVFQRFLDITYDMELSSTDS